MTSGPFDTIGAARALEAAGFERTPAESIASAIGQNGEHATTTDIAMLESRPGSRLASAICGLEARMNRALWIQGCTIVAIVTALKLLE